MSPGNRSQKEEASADCRLVIPILSYLSPSSGQQKTFGEKTESSSWKREGHIPKINYIGK